jgi:hypothetical protein
MPVAEYKQLSPEQVIMVPQGLSTYRPTLRASLLSSNSAC